MYRFYFPIQDISADKIIIKDLSQVHHLKNVLRFKINDEVIIFDEQGNEYNCLIEKILPQEVILKIKAKYSSSKKQLRISIACAIPKKSKMDDIVDKLTQLGVERIIPLLTERVVVRLDKDKKISLQKRWEKIILNAAQQSQRNTLPVIESIQDIKAALSQSPDYDLKLIPTLSEQGKTLKEIFTDIKPRNILVLIGPEGDFTLKEIDLAKQTGFIPVDLGDLVLRVDTAAIAIVSILNYVFRTN